MNKTHDSTQPRNEWQRRFYERCVEIRPSHHTDDTYMPNPGEVQFFVFGATEAHVYRFATDRSGAMASFVSVAACDVCDGGACERCGAGWVHIDSGSFDFDCDAMREAADRLQILADMYQVGGDVSQVPLSHDERAALVELHASATRDGYALTIWECDAIAVVRGARTVAHAPALQVVTRNGVKVAA